MAAQKLSGAEIRQKFLGFYADLRYQHILNTSQIAEA